MKDLLNQLASSGEFTSNHYCGRIYSTNFEKEVALSVAFDPGHTTFSQRQLNTIQQFIELSCGVKPFADLLFQHYDFMPRPKPMIPDATACFNVADFQELLIGPSWKGHVSLLHFHCPWVADGEDGALILMEDGIPSHLTTIDDTYPDEN